MIFKSKFSAYFYILPASLIMLVIVGIPLLITIGYSFTNVSQKNLLFDSSNLKKKQASYQNSASTLEAWSNENISYDASLKEAVGNAMLKRWLKKPEIKAVFELSLQDRQQKMMMQAEEFSEKAAAVDTQLEKRTVRFVGLKNYIRILGTADKTFWRIFLQTVIWTVVNVSAHFSIGLLLAICLHKRLKGNVIFRTLLMLPWAIPSFVAAFGWRYMYNYPTGLINNTLNAIGLPAINFLGDSSWVLPSCILVNIWVGIPFMMITLLGGLQSIDLALYEAADIDGAGAWHKFRHITIPMLKPVSSVAILLGIIWTFNMFNIIYLVSLGNEAIEKDIFVTYAYTAFRSYGDYSGAATYAVLILSILLAFGAYYVRMLPKEEK